MRLTAILLFAVAAGAAGAEPDWARIGDEAVARLQRYIQIETVNPPANTREAARFIAQELKAAGLDPTLYESGPQGQVNLVVRLAGRDRSRKPVLLLNHLDVVPVDRRMWRMDPFAGLVRDGFIWGRGALDMKGIGIQHLTALLTMKRLGVTPPRDIVMLMTADEETNGVYGIRWMIENHFAEIDAEYVLDEGGFGTRDILAPGKLVFGVAVGEKQTTWIRVRATGTAAHGSQPIADNANNRLLRALERAMELPGRGPVHPLVAEMRSRVGGELAGNKYTNAIQRNTISLTTLRSGVGEPPKVNVIPSVAEATLDCRLLPGVNAKQFLADMRTRINDPKVTLEVISSPDDAGVSNPRTGLFAAIERAITREHPDAIVTPILVPHGTDSVKLRAKGVIAYGLTPMILDLATATMHSDDERIPVEEFKKGIRIFYNVLTSEF